MLDELQEHVESIDMANGKFLHCFVAVVYFDLHEKTKFVFPISLRTQKS